MKDDYNLDELNTVTVRNLKFNIMPRYTYHYLDNDYEQFSLDLLDRLVEENSVAIDIGAHYGIYSLLAAKKAKKVYAFEPVPENFAILQKNIADNELEKVITPINKAVSDKEGDVTFNVTWASDSAGFYNHPNAEVIRKIKVRMAAVDNELKSVKDVSFIKIDTEGHELHVLDGLKKTLARNKSAKLLIEFNPQCLQNAGSPSKDLLQKIESLGYDMFALYEGTRYMARVDANTPEADVLQGGTYLNLLCLPKDSWLSALFVSHSAVIGGGELALLETTQKLLQVADKFIIPLVMLPGEGPLVDRFKDLPVALKVSQMRWWVNSNDLSEDEQRQVGMVNAKAMGDLAKVVAQFQPQVVLTNTMVIPWGALVAKAYGVPHVWSFHEFGDLDHKFTFNYGYEASLNLIDELSDAIIVNSKAVQKHVGRHLHKNKPELHYLNVDQPIVSATPPEETFSSDATLKLIMTGNVAPGKRQLDAVKAVKDLRSRGHKAELMIVGSLNAEAYAQEIRDYLAKHKLEPYVHLLGFKTNRFDYLNLADMQLICSDNEAFGLITVEAMLLGKPVVAANSGATPEIVQHEKTGFLYKPHDVNDLVKKIEQAAAYKDKTKLLAAAKSYAQKNFQTNYAKGLYAVLAKLAKKQHVRPMRGLYQDLLTGYYHLQDKHVQELQSLEQSSRRELQKFSDEYNKVYEAYHAVETQLNVLRKSKVVRVQSKLNRLRTKRRNR